MGGGGVFKEAEAEEARTRRQIWAMSRRGRQRRGVRGGRNGR